MTDRGRDQRRGWEYGHPEVTGRDLKCPLRTRRMFSPVFSYARLPSNRLSGLPKICSPCGAFWSIVVGHGAIPREGSLGGQPFGWSPG